MLCAIFSDGEVLADTLVFYDQASEITTTKGSLPGNVAVTQPPDKSLSYESAVASAREKFREMFPELQFLPDLPVPAGEDSD